VEERKHVCRREGNGFEGETCGCMWGTWGTSGEPSWWVGSGWVASREGSDGLMACNLISLQCWDRREGWQVGHAAGARTARIGNGRLTGS
jgi:hypothetical protein